MKNTLVSCYGGLTVERVDVAYAFIYRDDEKKLLMVIMLAAAGLYQEGQWSPVKHWNKPLFVK